VHASGADFWRASAFMAAAAAARCTAILQLHGSDFADAYERAGTALRMTMRLAFERAARVVVPSERLGALVRSLCRDACVAYVPPPVPQTATGTPLHERPRLVLFLGRLEAHRGTFELAEAVAALRGEVPGLRLVYAGEGERAALAQHAQRLGIADAVKFTGWVGPSGKRALLESAAVLAAPSYADGLPMGVLEAMAAGVPVVASAVGGVLEAVTDGVSGLLTAPGDAATLARQLRRLLLEPQTAVRIGAAARETARLRFSPERSLARLEEVYAEVGLTTLVVPSIPREPDMRQAA
jgi:glycosyltransferase involved in cell wall biosynthesis